MSNSKPTRAILVPLEETSAESGISIGDIFKAIRHIRIALVVLGVAIVAAGAMLYALADKKFQATTTIMVAEQSQGLSSLGGLDSQLGGLASLAGISLQGSGGIREEAYASLESRELVRTFILEEKLLPVLYSDYWNSADSTWQTDTGEPPPVEKAVSFFKENILEIRREPNRNIVDLSITWTDRSLCAEWANKLVGRVNDDLRTRSRREAAESIRFLEKELAASSNTSLQSAIFALIQQQMAKEMMANVQPDFAFRVIDPASVPTADSRVSPKLAVYVLVMIVLWTLLSGVAVFARAFFDADNPHDNTST